MAKDNELWDKLCTLDSLKRGWHLARTDMQQDFIKEPFSNETFGFFAEENLAELLRLLKTEKFTPSPLKRIPIPKGALGTRPGTLLAVEDRVILFAALRLIAKPLDKHLNENSVYSYRVKKEGKSSSLFYEGDAISLPFLKNKTVKKYIDPFDPWYGLWPKFDELSKKAFAEDDYRYMATSDIAAYFENIQLDLMREQLVGLMPREQKIINLFMTSFSAWTYDTEQGRRYLRGIPQGSQISSFFGNLFLKPIDDAFERFGDEHDVKYFRYMDDVRIFTKEYDVAREAILLLDTQIRRLHLNLQTAKTKIYDENDGEITATLIDRRLDQVSSIQDGISAERKLAKEEGRNVCYTKLLVKANKVLDEEPSSGIEEQKIRRARKPLKGMTDRVFRRLLSLHLTMNSDVLVGYLIKELKVNADSRLGLKLIRYGKGFPRKTQLQTQLFKLIEYRADIFPYQEAQILESLRYQSRIKKGLLEYCKKKAKGKKTDKLVAMQALRLIARCSIGAEEIKISKDIYENFQDVSVKKAAALILMRQRGKANTDFMQSIVFHPNNEMRKFGRLIRAIKNDSEKSMHFIKQSFKHDYLMVDNIPFFYLVVESTDKALVINLLDLIKDSRLQYEHINMDMRDRLKEVIKFGQQNLLR